MASTDVSATSASARESLRADAIGLREVLFQSITDMAPGAAIAASIPAGAAFAGGSLPLAVILALVASLLSASCVAELAARIPSAGSLATYAAKGLHPSIGFLVGWGYAFAALLVPPLVLVQLGFTVAPTLHSQWGAYPSSLWWPWALLGAAIICLAGLFGVRTSARLGSILGAFEIAVFLAAGIFFVVHAGSHNTLSVFTDKYTGKGYKGFNGIFAGSVFTVLAFAGFEAAAPLAEEARNPRRTVRRAVLGATIGIGLLYVFTTYAASVAFGPSRFSGFAGSGPASWVGLSKSFYGLLWVFVFFAIVNSTVANANAGVTVSSRTSFAMSRVGVLPPALSRLSALHRAPWVAIVVSTFVTVALTLGLGLGYGPTVAFSMLGTGIVIILAAIYIVTDAACLGYFLRNRPAFNFFLHLIVPILGIVAFLPAWLSAAGIRAFKFITPLAPPVSYMAYGVAAWTFLGLVYLAYHQRSHPERVTAVGLVHIDLPPEEISSRGAAPVPGST